MERRDDDKLQRGFERIVNFSDAVVAIAATLLVLPLVDIGVPEKGESVTELLRDHSAELSAFVLTFAVICRLWVTHHSIFRDIVGYSGPLLFAYFVWLLAIVFLPFPTQLIAVGSSTFPGADSVYLATIALAAVAAFATHVVVARRPNLAVDGSQGFGSTLESGVTFTLMLAAFGLSFTPIGMWSLVALLLTTPVVRTINAVMGRHTAE